MAEPVAASWMKELDDFKPPGPAGNLTARSNGSVTSRASGMHSARGGTGSAAAGGHGADVDELEQEMKLLHWHMLANEAALKAALIRTKKLKEQARRGVEGGWGVGRGWGLARARVDVCVCVSVARLGCVGGGVFTRKGVWLLG